MSGDLQLSMLDKLNTLLGKVNNLWTGHNDDWKFHLHTLTSIFNQWSFSIYSRKHENKLPVLAMQMSERDASIYMETPVVIWEIIWTMYNINVLLIQTLQLVAEVTHKVIKEITSNIDQINLKLFIKDYTDLPTWIEPNSNKNFLHKKISGITQCHICNPNLIQTNPDQRTSRFSTSKSQSLHKM